VFLLSWGVEALLMACNGARRTTRWSSRGLNKLLTMNGTTMIFMFIVPMMPGSVTTYVPLMIGALDMAFPRLECALLWL